MTAPRRWWCCRPKKAGELGVQPQAKILGYATFSREPEWFTLAPIGAITKLMEQLKLTVLDVDLFEINEAFAVVPMAAMAELGIPHDKVNVHGGAVALGHPIGASGARVLVTLAGGSETTPCTNRHCFAVHRRRRGRGPGRASQRLTFLARNWELRQEIT